MSRKRKGKQFRSNLLSNMVSRSKILFLFPSKALFNINRQLFVVNHNFGLTLFRKSLEKVNFNFPFKKQWRDGQKIASTPHQETIHRDKTYSINRREPFAGVSKVFAGNLEPPVVLDTPRSAPVEVMSQQIHIDILYVQPNHSMI